MWYSLDVYSRAACNPLGFRLNLITNSADVLRAAGESWGQSRQEFDGKPLDLRVVVSDVQIKAAKPRFEIERHLFSIISDRHNYAVADLNALYGACYVTQETVADQAWFRWFFLDAMVLSLLAQQHTVPVHAGCVSRDGAGTLLFGQSGAGKSTLSWACARAGWSLVGDDAAWLLPDTDQPTAIGRPQQVRLRPDAPRHFPELSGMATKARPNGKLSIELKTRDFPQIRTKSHTAVDRIVLLGRGDEPKLVPVSRDQALEAMLRDCVPYRDEVHARHVQTIERLADLPAWRLQYRTLDEALALL
jgi:hypothetical protein